MNNHAIYTHELLNSYTSSLTAHPVPFVGFCTVTQRKYMDHEAPQPFVSDDVFRPVWIAFVQVQRLFDSFYCERCGPHPLVVIMDGITAGFNAEHLTSSLRPPTTVEQNAPKRDDAHKPDRPLSAVFGPQRKLAQDVVRWRRQLTDTGESLLGGIGSDDLAEIAADADRDQTAAIRQMEKRRDSRDLRDNVMRDSIGRAATFLRSKVLPSLADMFEYAVAFEKGAAKETSRQLYLRLLEQVRLLVLPCRRGPTDWVAADFGT